jgi:hypothetical protein
MLYRIGYACSRASLLAALTLVGLVGVTPLASAADATASKTATHTIGLALTSWRNALYETPTASEECSLGVQPGEVAQFKASTEAMERLKQYGGTFENRGPNGETGNFSPLVVEDPLPFSELTTKVGYGVNLDGTQDGHATAKTHAHEKFTSPDGEKVDNQLARVIGCVQGYRTGGMMSDYYSQEVANFAVNRHLIEITGIHDETNDPSVEVTIYKGYDRLVRTGDDKFVPFLSQRIDERYPQYVMHTHGRIVDGVLITDPIRNALLPHSSERIIGDREMHDLTLRLKLTPDGAEGILAGYDNWEHWYNIHSKRVVSEVGKYTSPSIYRAFMRYADGYPDPKTGQCTYISSAYKVTAVRALIVHPIKDQHQIARN